MGGFKLCITQLARWNRKHIKRWNIQVYWTAAWYKQTSKIYGALTPRQKTGKVVLPSGEQSVTTETQHHQQVCCLLVKVASWIFDKTQNDSFNCLLHKYWMPSSRRGWAVWHPATAKVGHQKFNLSRTVLKHCNISAMFSSRLQLRPPHTTETKRSHADTQEQWRLW